MKIEKKLSTSLNAGKKAKFILTTAVGLVMALPYVANADRGGGGTGRVEITVEKTWGKEPKKVVVEEITYGPDRREAKCGRDEQENRRERDEDREDEYKHHRRHGHHHGWHREFDRHKHYGHRHGNGHGHGRRYGWNRRVVHEYHGH